MKFLQRLVRWPIALLLLVAGCGEVANWVPGTCSVSSLVGSWTSGSKSVEFKRDCQVSANVNLIGCSQNDLTYTSTVQSSGTVELTCPTSTETAFCTFAITGTSPLKELSLQCGGAGDGTYEESL